MRSVDRHPRHWLAFFAAAAPCLAAGACTEPTPQPPQLADCTGAHDASCTMFTGGGAGGVGASSKGQPDGGTEDADASLATEPSDATAACGQAVVLLGSLTPACADCVAAGQDAGSLSCCTQAMGCADDPTGCSAIWQCAVGCAAGGSCPIQTCGGPLYSAASIVLYDTLSQCMASACGRLGALCPSLSTITPGDF